MMNLKRLLPLVMPDGYPMTVKGISFTPEDKKAAGTAILEACKAMTNPEPVPLGSYRNFDMELSFDVFSREYRITLKGGLSHAVPLGDNAFGNITRLDNALEGMEPKLAGCKEQLEQAKAQMANAKIEVEKPFPQEAELAEKTSRLAEVNIALNLDKREPELMEGVPDEGEMEPQKKDRGRGR